MVNQQLIDYIKSQLQVGVGKDVIKSALLESGWAVVDVEDALKQASIAARTTAPGAAVQPAAQSVAASAGGVVMTSDIFQPKNEPVFDPKATVGSAAKAQAQPAGVTGKSAGPVVVGAAAAASASSGGRKFGGSFMVTIALGVGFVVCAGAAVYFYMQKSDLATQLVPLEATRTEADALKQKMTVLQQERDNLTAQVAQLQTTNGTLVGDLALFKMPDGTAPGATDGVVVTGTLRQDGSQFTIFTANEITIVIKNSKEAKVSGVLQPLIGNSITVSGTHVVGSREVTVTNVNGTRIQ
ncbi:MAG: hypothetical protein RL681_431 [Candidatus Parcubacteria bacterium]|jgi:hypothetical protein